MCDTHLVIFLAKRYKADIAHNHRVESVDVHVGNIISDTYPRRIGQAH